MKNNFYSLLYILIFINLLTLSVANDDFNFDVTEIEITQNGNLVEGSKGGKVITNDGYEIIGENFLYDKSTNILEVTGSVKLISNIDDLIIFTDKATYLKNDEIIFTEGNSKAEDLNNIITASNFKFDKLKNILNADKNVKFLTRDDKKQLTIYSDKATYLKNDEIIFTEGNSKAEDLNNIITASNFKFDKLKNILIADKNVTYLDKINNDKINTERAIYYKNDEIIKTEGKTNAVVDNKYNFLSENVIYKKKISKLSSNKKSTIKDGDENIYNLDTFIYDINKKFLKGTNVNITSKVDEKKYDNFFFSEGFFDLNNKSFISKETKIKLHKDIFDNEDQDPRLYGVSSQGDEKKTIVKKGIFTSCKLTDDCPPWSIKSEEIIHDKVKRDMIYKNAILKIYDVPVLYFPKFFHPDPSVERRTGFLQPQFNRSKVLGSSVYVPYFKTLGINKDYTFKPTIFEDKYILQNEFRSKTENSSLISDFSFLNGYKSSVDNEKKNINHFFLNYEKNLEIDEYLESILDASIQRVNNDTYLKVFQNNLFPTPVIPKNQSLMESYVNLNLEKEDSSFSTKIQVFESLGTKHSDRYQYVLPSYIFTKNLNISNVDGIINLKSTGSNRLRNTNNLKTAVVNDLKFKSLDYYSGKGFKNNFSIYFKNLNAVGKNDLVYDSSPTIDAMSIFEVGSSFPLLKEDLENKQILTPKVSFRLNPGNDKRNSTATNIVDAHNAFEINRLGISDSFEAGKSITMGLDYKFDIKNEISSKNKYLEFKLATVFRDKVEDKIPEVSTLDKKGSNIFGSIDNQIFENLNLSYDFSLDNDLETIESHLINTEISINNFITEFHFVEQRKDLGSAHILKSKFSYNVDENNLFSFSTRRNKAINLTEYYDLSYEYKNDCLTAGIKYNKTFYQDNDLKPTENLFFTITLIPLTTYERTIYDK